MDILRLVCLYEDSIISERKQQAKAILSALKINTECSVLLTQPLYIVTEYTDISNPLFDTIYVSADSKYMVVKYYKTETSEATGDSISVSL